MHKRKISQWRDPSPDKIRKWDYDSDSSSSSYVSCSSASMSDHGERSGPRMALALINGVAPGVKFDSSRGKIVVSLSRCDENNFLGTPNIRSPDYISPLSCLNPKIVKKVCPAPGKSKVKTYTGQGTAAGTNNRKETRRALRPFAAGMTAAKFSRKMEWRDPSPGKEDYDSDSSTNSASCSSASMSEYGDRSGPRNRRPLALINGTIPGVSLNYSARLSSGNEEGMIQMSISGFEESDASMKTEEGMIQMSISGFGENADSMKTTPSLDYTCSPPSWHNPKIVKKACPTPYQAKVETPAGKSPSPAYATSTNNLEEARRELRTFAADMTAEELFRKMDKARALEMKIRGEVDEESHTSYDSERKGLIRGRRLSFSSAIKVDDGLHRAAPNPHVCLEASSSAPEASDQAPEAAEIDKVVNGLDHELEKSVVDDSMEVEDGLGMPDIMVNHDIKLDAQPLQGDETHAEQEENGQRFSFDSADGAAAGKENRMWGLDLAQLNSLEGDLRDWLPDLRPPVPVSFDETDDDDGVLIFEVNQFQNPDEDVPEFVPPLFPVEINQFDVDDQKEVLKILLARTFKDLYPFDFNVSPNIIGEAALKLASELGMKNFNAPGEKWLKSWKTDYLNNPYALSYGWQVGRIVDTKEGDVLHRIIYLTGKRVSPTNPFSLVNNFKFQSPHLQKVDFENFIGKRCLGAMNQGRLKVIIWIKPINGVTKKRVRFTPSSASRPAWTPRSSVTPTFKRRSSVRGGKNMEAIIRYNEMCDARAAALGLQWPPEDELIDVEDPDKEAEQSASQDEDEYYCFDFQNMFTKEELDFLFAEEEVVDVE